MGLNLSLSNLGKQLDPSSWNKNDWGKAALIGGAVAGAYDWTGNGTSASTPISGTGEMNASGTGIIPGTEKMSSGTGNWGFGNYGTNTGAVGDFFTGSTKVQQVANPWVNAGATLGSAFLQGEATEKAAEINAKTAAEYLAKAEEDEKAAAGRLTTANSAFTGGF